MGSSESRVKQDAGVEEASTPPYGVQVSERFARRIQTGQSDSRSQARSAAESNPNEGADRYAPRPDWASWHSSYGHESNHPFWLDPPGSLFSVFI